MYVLLVHSRCLYYAAFSDNFVKVAMLFVIRWDHTANHCHIFPELDL